MVANGSYREEIEKVIGRGRHAHRIEEGAWAVDMMSTLNCLSISVAMDLAAELGTTSWDYEQAGRVLVGSPFYQDPHPRLLGLALAIITWISWQAQTHGNIPKEQIRKLTEEAWKQGEERAAHLY